MGTQSAHLDQTPALTPTVRTPQCGHTVWGTINKKKSSRYHLLWRRPDATCPGNWIHASLPSTQAHESW